MDFDLDNPLLQQVASQIDIESLASEALDLFPAESRDQGIPESIIGAIRDFVTESHIARDIGRLTVGDVVRALGISPGETADVGLPDSLPVVAALDFMASQDAQTALVRTAEGPAIIGYEALRQVGDGLRSLFLQAANQTLARVLLLITPWKSPLAIGDSAWRGAVGRFAGRLMYFRCQTDPGHCFPSGEDEAWCVFEDGAVDRVSNC